jgi:hypothetical protein
MGASGSRSSSRDFFIEREKVIYEKENMFMLAAAAFLVYYLTKKKTAPPIEILKVNAKNKSVSYKINYNGESLSDTQYVTDSPNFIPLKNGLYAAAFKSGLDTIVIAIGEKNNTAFKATVAEKIISF